MNRIKLLYDVVRTMKGKEKVDGILTAHVHKDHEEVLSLRNEFGKSATGNATTKVSCELNIDGSRIKRDSLTEFSTPGDCQHHRGLLGKFFRHRHGHGECCGFKGILSRLALALTILNSLQVEEQERGRKMVSFDLSDAPDEMRLLLLEKINQRHSSHPHCGFLSEFDAFETLDGIVVLTVNDRYEIERLTVNLDGRVKNTACELNMLAASVKVEFAW